MASTVVYRHRFGSLVRAYQMIGYAPEPDYAFIEINRRLRRLHPDIVEDAVRSLEALGGKVVRDQDTDLLHVNGMITASIVLSRCHQTPGGSYR